MALENQMATAIEVLLEIRDLLKSGASTTAAPKKTTTEKSTGKKTAEKPAAKQELDDDDLDSGSSSNAGDDLDGDLGGDDDGLGGEEEAKYSADDVKSALMDVKNKAGKDKALEIMKKQGKSSSVGGIQPENFEAVMQACEKATKGK